MTDDIDELLPHTRIEYALDEIGVYKWQDDYDEITARLIQMEIRRR